MIRQQQTTCGEQKNATTAVVGPCARAVPSPYTVASGFCHMLSRIVPFSIGGAIYVFFYSKPHPTQHVPLLASWRSLTWRSKCDSLLEIIPIIRITSFVCCAYFLNNRSIVGTSISSTQEVVKVLLLTPKKYCG